MNCSVSDRQNDCMLQICFTEVLHNSTICWIMVPLLFSVSSWTSICNIPMVCIQLFLLTWGVISILCFSFQHIKFWLSQLTISHSWQFYVNLFISKWNIINLFYCRDDLLLETGFLCLLVAPLIPRKPRGLKVSPCDKINMWLVKWLLFRFIFSNGVVKLISGCPKWWDLTGTY